MKRITGNRKTGKQLPIILALTALLLLLPQTAFAASGSCGPDLTWEYRPLSGTLYINGSGEMDNWTIETPWDRPQPWGAYLEDIEEIVLSKNVKSIGDHAFEGCTGVTEIEFPATLKRIGAYSFYNCSLERLVIPASVTEIGEGAFSFCQALHSVYFGKCTAVIEKAAFEGCKKLVDVNVSDLGVWCSISFQSSTANPLYHGNAKLRLSGNSYELVEDAVIPDGVTAIGAFTFFNYKPLKNVICPSTVQTIGAGAFENCDNLSRIVLPDALTSVGSSAFAYCTSLTEIDFPDNVTKMGDAVFENCSALRHVTLGKSVDCIGYNAFKNCAALTEIVIPDTAKSIGNNAFYKCENLASITIGSNVRSCGLESFFRCRNLEKVNIRDLANWCSASIPNNEDSSPLAYSRELYVDGEKVTDLVIPEGVTNIGQYAFAWCSGFRSVTIPEGVTSIGQHAFDMASGLTTVKLPSTLNSIDGFAFASTSVNALYVPDIETWLNIRLWNSYSNPVSDHFGALYLDGEPAEKLVIPDGVTCIDKHRFDGMRNIRSIVLPKSVQRIDTWAFYLCENIQDIYYAGTAEEWNAIVLEDYNGSLSGAAVHLESTGDNETSGSVFSNGSVIIAAACTALLVGIALGLLIGKKVFSSKQKAEKASPASDDPEEALEAESKK